MAVKRKIINLAVNDSILTATDAATGQPISDAGFQGENGAVWFHCDVPGDWQDLKVRLQLVAMDGSYDESELSVNNAIDMPIRQGVTIPGRLSVVLQGSDAGGNIRKTADCKVLTIQPSTVPINEIPNKYPLAFEDLEDRVNSNDATIHNHITDNKNPHGVTAAQLGLGNVDNTHDADKPVSTAQAAAINQVQANLTSHKADTNNPHGVTYLQAGAEQAGSVSSHNNNVSAHSGLFSAKADRSSTYTKQEMDASLALKANDSDVVKTVTGSGGALVTRAGAAVNVNVSGTGGDMLQANYIKGIGQYNANKVDHAAYADTTEYSRGAQTLSNSNPAFLTGTSDTSQAPIDFPDGSPVDLSFDGKTANSQSISNPVIKSIGKNLFNPAAGAVSSNGVTCTVANDGTITLNGTAAAGVWIQLIPTLKVGLYANSAPAVKLQNGSQYTLGHTVLSGSKSGNMIYALFDTAGTAYPSNYLIDLQDYGSPYTFTAGSNASLSNLLTVGMFNLVISAGAVFNHYSFRLQMEQNNAATVWEQYKESVLTISETFGDGDIFLYINGLALKNSASANVTGNLKAYKNGTFLIFNTPVNPKLRITYNKIGNMSSGDFANGSGINNPYAVDRSKTAETAKAPESGSVLDTFMKSFTGKIGFFARQTAPDGWLIADGSAVSRTTYANLFSAIGTLYGAGDGTVTFNLPDLRGYFVRAWDSRSNGGVDNGRAFGSIQQDDFSSHNHTYPAGNASALDQQSGGLWKVSTDTPECFFQGNIWTNKTGGAETRPKNIALLACIKT